MDYDDIIDDMFDDARVVGTAPIRRLGLSYPEVLAWATELHVTKVGASFAWTREDAEALAEALRALDQEETEEPDQEEEGEDEEDEEGTQSVGDEAGEGAD